MNIAIFFQYQPEVGGGFQQSLNVITELSKHFSGKHKLVVFSTTMDIKGMVIGLGLEFRYVRFSFFKTLKLYLRLFPYFRNISFLGWISKTSPIDKMLLKENIDLVVFTSPSEFSLYLEKFNYVFYLFDQSHRDFVEFPESSHSGKFEKREILYRRALIKATAVLVDSETGKGMVTRRYNVDNERVFVLRYLPASFVHLTEEQYAGKYVDIKKKYMIDGDYIFYPAQLWSHKNHVYVLDALAILKKNHQKKIHFIFTGSDKGNLAHILEYAKSAGVEDQIHFPGFVPDDIMPYLYKQSIALVMPTWFGPTNLPPLEAFALDTPVIYSSIKGIIEPFDDATLPIDLNDPQTLADHVMDLLSNHGLRESCVIKGRKYLENFPTDYYYQVFNKIFEQYAVKLKTWKN